MPVEAPLGTAALNSPKVDRGGGDRARKRRVRGKKRDMWKRREGGIKQGK